MLSPFGHRRPRTDDAARFAATAGFVSRPVSDFPRLAGAVAGLDAALDAPARGVSGYFVFGSFVRGSLAGDPFKDVDVVTRGLDDRERLRPLHMAYIPLPVGAGTRQVRVDLNPRVFTTPYQLMNRSDWTITQAVYAWPERRVYLAETFFEDLTARVLRVNALSTELPLHIILRSYKYGIRGFRTGEDDVLQVLRAYRARSRLRIWFEALHFLRRRSGTILPG